MLALLTTQDVISTMALANNGSQSSTEVALAAAAVNANRISTDIGFKLTGLSNYSVWAYRVQSLLAALDCWDSETQSPKKSATALHAILSNL